MVEIKENQVLEVDNLLSFRGKVKQCLIEQIGKDMEEHIKQAGGKIIGYPITATYSVNNDIIDVELLIPVDKKISEIKKYVFKEKLKIVNAVVAKHEGNISNLQATCNELSNYIEQRKFTPLTVGYNVTRIDQVGNLRSIIYIYVGVNGNIT